MHDPAELREWVYAIARADGAAFERLYRALIVKVYTVVHRILRDHALAEECAAEVFVQVWRHSGRYHGERGEVVPWLLNMARSRAIDVLRRRRLEQSIAPIDTESRSGAERDPVGLLEDFAASSAVRQAMGELSSGQVQVILAAFFGGESTSEIALRTAMPHGTVKSHLRRGLRKLKDCLSGHAEHLLGS